MQGQHESFKQSANDLLKPIIDQMAGVSQQKFPPSTVKDRIINAIDLYWQSIDHAANKQQLASVHKKLTKAHELMC